MNTKLQHIGIGHETLTSWQRRRYGMRRFIRWLMRRGSRDGHTVYLRTTGTTVRAGKEQP